MVNFRSEVETIFPTRVANALQREGVRTLEDLKRKYPHPEDLLQIRNLGSVAVKEIIQACSEMGMEYGAFEPGDFLATLKEADWERIRSVRLFVDMDGTLVTWRPTTTFEQLLEPGYFRNMPPYTSVVEAVRMLVQNGIKPYTLSSYMEESKYALDEKNGWLDEFLPEIPQENRLFCPCTMSKSAFVQSVFGSMLNADYFLLDDYSENLHDWADTGGTGIKLMNGLNGSKGSWTGAKVYRKQYAESISRDILRYIYFLGEEQASA